ncbi:MAG: DUF4920 domain-containing protein [Ginsengibacter sp.]
MKKMFLFAFMFLSVATYAQEKPAEKGALYGSEVTEKNAISVAELSKKLESEKQFSGQVKGKVVSVCQAEGCWMKLAKDDGENIMIRFKDHKFFVPKDINGKEVILDGVAKTSVTSVEMLKHYAKDAGKPDEEIAKIAEPKKEITFTASGVLVL